MKFLLGFGLSILMGWGGYVKKALSKGGMIGAIIVGTAIFGLGGWLWGSLLIAFFISSSLLSFFKATNKEEVAAQFDKGSQRDFSQAMANGGVGAVIALLNAIWPQNGWWYAFLGAMGSVNADTWATELGILSKEKPRLITTGEFVPTGTSGGITGLGTLAALAGGAFIGVVAWLLTAINQKLTKKNNVSQPKQFILIAGVGGLAGALIDSWFGATKQAIYYCDTCDKETEQKIHHVCDDTPTRFLRGFYWLNNDAVNFICAIFGSFIAWAVYLILKILNKG